MSEHLQDHAPVRLPPPFVLLGHLALALALGWSIRIPVPMPFYLHLLGLLVVLAGLLLAFSAVRAMARLGTPIDPYEPVKAVVTAGPYRLTRNPIYLGFVCALAGLPLALGTYWGLLLVPLMIIVMTLLVVRHEEAYLERKFGRVYLEYKSSVRRWL